MEKYVGHGNMGFYFTMHNIFIMLLKPYQVYHAWKAKNRKKNTTLDSSTGSMRAPASLMIEANRQQVVVDRANSSTQDQRYFRIPFVRPGVILRQKYFVSVLKAVT